MTNQTRLNIIKSIHTLIWIMYVSIIGYVIWSGITGDITIYSWIAVAAVVFEGLVLSIFKWQCPLTVIARKYTNATADNFDIYLPEWLARYNKLIFTSLFVMGVLLMLIKIW